MQIYQIYLILSSVGAVEKFCKYSAVDIHSVVDTHKHLHYHYMKIFASRAIIYFNISLTLNLLECFRVSSYCNKDLVSICKISQSNQWQGSSRSCLDWTNIWRISGVTAHGFCLWLRWGLYLWRQILYNIYKDLCS